MARRDRTTNAASAKFYYDDCYKAIAPADFTRANQIRSLLIANSNKGLLRGQESGRVDRGRLANLIAGDRNVFTRRQPKQDTNTVVQICVDASGSMRWEPTLKAIILLDKVFLGSGITHEILTWSGGFGGWELNQLRAPGDSPARAWTVGAFANVRGGGTPTAGALPMSANRLLAHRDARKVMIFVSDGQPNFDKETVECRRMVTELFPKVGIEIFGVSIGDSSLEQIIPITGKAPEFEDFSKVLLDTAKRALL